MEPLHKSLLDLLRELERCGVPLTVGGGYGLYLKRMHLARTGEQSLFTELPEVRSTNDIDMFLRAEVLADLSRTISGVDTNQLSDSLSTLAETFADTPDQLRSAVQGVTRFAATIDTRDAQLRTLLANAAKVTGVLAKRSLAAGVGRLGYGSVRIRCHPGAVVGEAVRKSGFHLERLALAHRSRRVRSGRKGRLPAPGREAPASGGCA